jgi:dTDP-4-amino-4,6-dideoxygalactose transaminase
MSTFLIRETYGIGVGKLLHAFLKKFDLLSKPMIHQQTDKIFGLPNWYCHLIYLQFMGLKKDLIHRKKIAAVYASELRASVVSDFLVKQISKASNLRFPVFVEKRESLIHSLKRNNIFVSDIWYDAPIAPKKYLHLTDYKDQCPNSDRVSEKILDLPTHKGASENDARFIAEKVNEWIRNDKE